MNRKQFLDYWYSDCSHEGFQLWDEPASEDDEELHEQTFTKSFFDEEMMETD